MKPRKETVSLVFRLWILATVFVWPFIEGWGIALWAAVGGGLALWWRQMPEDPPAPPERLPYQHLYAHLSHAAPAEPPDPAAKTSPSDVPTRADEPRVP